jgi:hypothetical protein
MATVITMAIIAKRIRIGPPDGNIGPFYLRNMEMLVKLERLPGRKR